ncbi:MAG: bacterioferritin-associated ferredoxin [Cellvibrio sp.]
MYVCLCRGITDRQIKSAIADGARHLGHLRKQLGVATQCGKCACLAKDLLAAEQAINTATDDNRDATRFYAVTC